MRCARAAINRASTRSGTIRPAPGKRTTAFGSIMCCCRRRPPTGSSALRSTSMYGPGRSRLTTCQWWSIWLSILRNAAVAAPVFDVTVRQRSLVHVRLRHGAAIGLADPGIVRARAVLGDREPEQAHGGLARNPLPPEQHAAEQGLRAALALVRCQPQPARRLDAVLGGAVAEQVDPAEMILGIGIAEVGRGMAEQVERDRWVRLHRGVGDALEIE